MKKARRDCLRVDGSVLILGRRGRHDKVVGAHPCRINYCRAVLSSSEIELEFLAKLKTNSVRNHLWT